MPSDCVMQARLCCCGGGRGGVNDQRGQQWIQSLAPSTVNTSSAPRSIDNSSVVASSLCAPIAITFSPRNMKVISWAHTLAAINTRGAPSRLTTLQQQRLRVHSRQSIDGGITTATTTKQPRAHAQESRSTVSTGINWCAVSRSLAVQQEKNATNQKNDTPTLAFDSLRFTAVGLANSKHKQQQKNNRKWNVCCYQLCGLTCTATHTLAPITDRFQHSHMLHAQIRYK